MTIMLSANHGGGGGGSDIMIDIGNKSTNRKRSIPVRRRQDAVIEIPDYLSDSIDLQAHLSVKKAGGSVHLSPALEDSLKVLFLRFILDKWTL